MQTLSNKYRPFLRIVTGPGKKEYVTVAINEDVGSREHVKTIMSFGRANNSENWDKAIEFTLNELRNCYKKYKEQFIDS